MNADDLAKELTGRPHEIMSGIGASGNRYWLVTQLDTPNNPNAFVTAYSENTVAANGASVVEQLKAMNEWWADYVAAAITENRHWVDACREIGITIDWHPGHTP